MLPRVALVRTDVLEELSASISRVTRIGELGTTLAVSSNRRTLHFVFLRSVRRLLVTVNVVPSSPIFVTLMMQELSSSETRFLQEPNGVTSQNTAFFIVTAVKTSNLSGHRICFLLHVYVFDLIQWRVGWGTAHPIFVRVGGRMFKCMYFAL
jgi:hypothetical protein